MSLIFKVMKTKRISLESLKLAISENYKSLEDKVNNLVANTDFRVDELSFGATCTSINLVIYSSDDKKKPVLCANLTLLLEEDPFDDSKEPQFTTNIGSTGKFSLEDTSKESRANFYIQVGKILADSEALGKIKNAMIAHSAAISELRKQWK